MGRLSLDGFIESTDTITALRWHLSANHYPAIPEVMVQPCLVAIGLGAQGLWDTVIKLPKGVLWRGQDSCSVMALSQHAHLEGFIESELTLLDSDSDNDSDSDETE